MFLKARLQIAIVALVAQVVIAMSVLYLYYFTDTTFSSARERADEVAKGVKDNLVELLNRETAARGLHPATLPESQAVWTDIIKNDPKVTDMLKRTVQNTEALQAIVVTEDQGSILSSSSSVVPSAKVAPIHDFQDLKKRIWIANLRDLMTRREDYSTTLSIGFLNKTQQVVLFNITVFIQSVFLKRDVAPTLKTLGLTFASSLFIAIFLGSV